MREQKTFLQYTEKDKWTRMLKVVQANTHRLPPDIKLPFKKLAIVRFIFNNLLLLLIQYSGLHLSNLSSGPAPVWFATGTACAFLFLRGFSVLPGIYVGNFLGYFAAKIGFGYALAFATVISGQAVVLLWLHYHYLSPTLIFYRLPTYIQFVAYTAVLTATVSLVLLFLYVSCWPRQESALCIWAYLWLGNLNAILIFSCAYLTWDAYSLRTDPIQKSTRWLRNILYLILISTNLALAFSTSAAAGWILGLISIVITMIISIYFGWCGAIAASFLSAILLSFAAFLDAPVFHTSFANIMVLSIQILLCVQTITALSIGIQQKKHSAQLAHTF